MGENLQPGSIPGHGVVGGDGALHLDGEHIAPLGLLDRHEGGARLGRGDGETAVVARQIALLEEAVGRLGGGDAGQLELLGQAVLQGAEGPLAAPASLRRVGRDVLDAELGQGASNLGQHALGHLGAGFRRVEVVARAVGIEAAGQAVNRNGLRQGCKLDAVPSSSTRTAE